MKDINIEFIDKTEKVTKVETIEISDKDKFILKLEWNDGIAPITIEQVSRFSSLFRDGLENDSRIFVLPNCMSVQIIRAV